MYDESFRCPSDGYAGYWVSIDGHSARSCGGAADEQALTEDIIALAKQYGRYGYRRVTALLCHEGWTVNHKRV
ncbi:hypothetical protein FHS85_004943 [Rhodoligotrophos appendicifer]